MGAGTCVLLPGSGAEALVKLFPVTVGGRLQSKPVRVSRKEFFSHSRLPSAGEQVEDWLLFSPETGDKQGVGRSAGAAR